MTHAPEYIINGTKVEVGQGYKRRDGTRVVIDGLHDLIVASGSTRFENGRYYTTCNGRLDFIKCVGRVVPLPIIHKPSPNQWIDFIGNECPVDENSYVDVEIESEFIIGNPQKEIRIRQHAKDINWSGKQHKVIRYKNYDIECRLQSTGSATFVPLEEVREQFPCKMTHIKHGNVYVHGKSINKKNHFIYETINPHITQISNGIDHVSFFTVTEKNTEPQPDADGWIEWHGGECPVDDVMCRKMQWRHIIKSKKIE